MCNIVAGNIFAAAADLGFFLLFFGFGHFTHFAAQPELYKYCKLILNGWRGYGVYSSC